MKIEIKERGSEAFYREIINVTVRYNKLIRKPEARVNDTFKSLKGNIILAIVFVLLLVLDAVLWGPTSITWILVALLVFIGILSSVMLDSYNKRLRVMLNDDPEATLTLDDNGIELVKKAITVRLSWENIAFARAFKESICFIPKKQTDLVICVSLKHYDEIRPYIKSRMYEG